MTDLDSLIKKARLVAQREQDFERENTYSFDRIGRESYVEKMKDAGYVEIEAFSTADLTKGYFCNTCEYLEKRNASPTGYWCRKFGFPDRPFGCCDGWAWSP